MNDVTGELEIQSDWTDACGYRWNVEHLGCATLTEFLARDRGGHYGYLVGKLLSPDRRMRFSPEETVKAMRRRVIEARRAASLDAAAARELWDSLDELESVDNRDDFYRQVIDVTSYREHIGDPWDDGCDAPTREAIALDKVILPALADACHRELARRALAAANGPQDGAP